MRQVVFKIHASIDGFIGRPDGDVEWVFEHFDDEMGEWEVGLIESAGLHAMGRNLYGDMAEHWPTATDPFAAPMNEIPKLVFSATLEEAEWGPTRIVRGSAVEAVTALKAEDGKPVLVHGGAAIAQTLSAAGLIDVYHLIVHPIAIGAGLPIFESQVDLRLVEVRQFPKGAMLLTYEPAGSVAGDRRRDTEVPQD
jgi:dihydrofolate reductase